MTIFLIGCPTCRRCVAAKQQGNAVIYTHNDNADVTHGEQIVVGNCPTCKTLLVGHMHQTAGPNSNRDADEWSVPIRVYPNPSTTFFSSRIPKVLTRSLEEADRCMQAGAETAACVMFGRALEALCRDVLKTNEHLMLKKCLELLKEQNHINSQLHDWGKELNALRNVAAHPDDSEISRRDAEDLQAFIHAIVGYVYDLTDRYRMFKKRSLIDESGTQKPKRRNKKT